MPSIQPSSIAYKLDGAAAEAAKQLMELEREILQEKHGKHYPSGPRANLVRREVMDELRRKAPALMATLGLDRPALQIELEHGGHPRAYEEYPYIGVGETQEETEYFVFCPVDYKGDHSAPAGGKRVADDDMRPTDFGELVYQRKAYVGLPLVWQLKRGTAMPADFDPETHNYNDRGSAGRHYKVFIAGGSSLSCVSEYLRRRDELAGAREAMQKAIESLSPALQGKLLGISAGEELGLQCYFQTDDNGKTETWVRLANKSRDGAPVVVRDNDHFVADDFRDGAFRIKPNRETEAGQKLGRLFDRLLSEPDLGQYWQIHNPTASGLKGQFHGHPKLGNRVPRLDTVRGVHYLVYELDKDAAKDHCNPPGGIPVNLAEYLWLKADMRDEAEFVRLADPPPQLEHMRPIKPAPRP